MPDTDLAPHRRTPESQLVAAIGEGDALALAEALHRTLTTAHACTRRLLGTGPRLETLLHRLYLELWDTGPSAQPLERWVRNRCFVLGAEDLRVRTSAPASASLHLLLDDLPATDGPADSGERALADLTSSERLAVLRAHDQGLPSDEHDDPQAAEALERALVALAGQGLEPAVGDPCEDLEGMGDWTLGLLPTDQAAGLLETVTRRPECAARSRLLRRGRRRLEGLPPPPDLGMRLMAAIVGPPRAPASVPAPIVIPVDPRPAHPLRHAIPDDQPVTADHTQTLASGSSDDAPGATVGATVGVTAASTADGLPETAVEDDADAAGVDGAEESTLRRLVRGVSLLIAGMGAGLIVGAAILLLAR